MTISIDGQGVECRIVEDSISELAQVVLFDRPAETIGAMVEQVIADRLPRPSWSQPRDEIARLARGLERERDEARRAHVRAHLASWVGPGKPTLQEHAEFLYPGAGASLFDKNERVTVCDGGPVGAVGLGYVTGLLLRGDGK